MISNETITLPDKSVERRGALGRAIIDEAARGEAEIATSALTLAEVVKHPLSETRPTEAADKIAEFFENDYIVIVPIDRRVGELARSYMQRCYIDRSFPKLKPCDAIHLAAASVANAEEMHTFDTRVLNVDGRLERLDGVKLKICKPSMGGPLLPLLESPPLQKQADDVRADEAGDGEGASDLKREDGSSKQPLHGDGEDAGLLRGRGDISGATEADSSTGPESKED